MSTALPPRVRASVDVHLYVHELSRLVGKSFNKERASADEICSRSRPTSGGTQPLLDIPDCPDGIGYLPRCLSKKRAISSNASRVSGAFTSR
jgi:hypothetical protein